MAKINGQKYPELAPEEAEEIIDVLVNEYGGEVSSEEAFAQSIGHSTANSGAYRGKIADLRRYGLLESRGLEPTPLAFDLANPEDTADEYQSKFRMLQNVPILSDLHENLGGREPPNELWRVIEEITNANPKESREAAKDIDGLYRDMLEFDERRDRTVSGKDTSPRGTRGATRESDPVQPESTVGILIRIDGDEMKFESVNNANLELAKAFIDNRIANSGWNLENSEKEEDGFQDTISD